MLDLRDSQLSMLLRVARKDIVMQDPRFSPSPYFNESEPAVMLSDLSRVINGKRISGNRNRPVAALVWDSRQVVRGSVFFAIKGENIDGNDHIPEAIQRGAIAIVSGRAGKKRPDISYIETDDVRIALANASRRFYGAPDTKLNLIGVTGTNGKTTVTRMVKYLLDEGNDKCGLIGTIDYVVGQRVLPSHKTTPEVDETCALLAEMVESNCESAAIELSSHGVDQNRTFGFEFDTLAFLNLSQDHLDYHGDMDHYFDVKARLFEGVSNPLPKNAVINVDDERSAQLIARLDLKIRTLTFSAKGKDADFIANHVRVSEKGTRFELYSPEGIFEVMLPLLGAFNVSNALAAIACAFASGKPVSELVRLISEIKSVPGRMEVVSEGQNFLTIVDYAHTHDALDKLLHTVRSLTNGKLTTVFGCGGDRDREKRPLMMEAVCRYSDNVIATSDNPRNEAQSRIFDDMLRGMDGNTRVQFVDDREAAIREAIENAQSGDAVVIAGKGHETFQIIENSMIPFDDRLVARAVLKEVCDSKFEQGGDR